MNNQQIPGMMYPAQKAMLAGNPRDSAIMAQELTNQKQVDLINAVGGYHKNRKHNKKHSKRHSKRHIKKHSTKRNKTKKYRSVKRLKREKKNWYSLKGGNIVVPQFTMQYTPQGVDGQDPNSLIKLNSQISTQASANSVYDKLALQGGLKSIKRKYRKQ